jgi:hypothetical protein
VPQTHCISRLVPLSSVILPKKLLINSHLWDKIVLRASKHDTWRMPPIKCHAYEEGFLPTSRLQAARALAIASFADDQLFSCVQVEVVDD